MMEPSYDAYQFDGSKSISKALAKNHIAWTDLNASMSIYHHKEVQERRLPTPIWALNDEFLRHLLVVFLETRLHIYNPTGTLVERREAARAMAIADRTRQAATLDGLNLRYVEESKAGAAPERLAALQLQIENLDTIIRTSENGGMDLAAAVVYLYHRCKYNSVQVGEECKIKPPHVRQILFRLAHLWEKRFNEDGTLKPVVRIPRSARTVEPKLRKKRRLTWDIKEAILLRIFGFTYKQISARLGVSDMTVYAAFQKYGIVCPILKAPEPKDPAHDFDWNRVAELRRGGRSSRDIAKFLGITHTGVLYAIRQLGVKPEKPVRYGPKRKYDWNRIAELRRAGNTYRAIAEELGYQIGYVTRICLDKFNIRIHQTRHFGGPSRKVDPIRASELRKTGMLWKQIDAEFGVKSGVAYTAVKRAGLLEKYYKAQTPRAVKKYAPALPGESRKARRARLIAAGMCGYCGLKERGKLSECGECRAKYNVIARDYYERKKAARLAGRPATEQQADQEQVTSNFEGVQPAPADTAGMEAYAYA
jgi:DNA-binding CsgD family transcriptional regulator